MKLEVVGVQAVLKGYGKARTDDARAIDEGLKRCAEILLNASQKLVPVLTGKLKASGQIQGNGKKGFGAEWIVVYTAPYAWFVHEDMEAKHAAPTQAKYLSDALRRVRGTMTAVLERQLKASVSKTTSGGNDDSM